MKTLLKATGSFIVGLALMFSMVLPAFASSHAEAPLTSMDRYADNTDVYAFRSTEAGRGLYVTILANFVPFQDPSGGPQFFRFDDTVLYAINIDNDGDGVADISYQFQFNTEIVRPNTALGHTTVTQDGIVSSLADLDYNMPQTFIVRRVDRNSQSPNPFNGMPGLVVGTGRTPPSNVGPRVTPNYEANLGSQAIYSLSNGGKVFAGQRDEGFFIDVGGIFDGFGLRSIGASGGVDTLRGFNVSSIAIEVPIFDLARSGSAPVDPTAQDAVIGIWSTASRRSTSVLNDNSKRVSFGNFKQVSRLGNPLVNEVVVPLELKDGFNASNPTQDAALVPTILDPEAPKLIKTIFNLYGPLGGPPLPSFNVPSAPRNDLALIFALGIPAGAVPGAPNFTTVIAGSNGPHEYLRLNVAIPPSASPNRLGLLGNDPAGFPNGRRVTDDVVDIELRALVGGTPFTPAFNIAPNNVLGDGVSTNEQPYLSRFPYLASPNPGNTPRPTNFPAQRPEDDGAFSIVDSSEKVESRWNR